MIAGKIRVGKILESTGQFRIIIWIYEINPGIWCNIKLIPFNFPQRMCLKSKFKSNFSFGPVVDQSV